MWRFGMKSDRHNQIVNLIAREGMVKNPQLMEMFDISIETVRRDLEFLEQQGYLRRVYGGAVANVSLRSEPEYASRSKTQFQEKNAIAEAAVKLITPEDTLYLGVGTTVQAMVQYMKGLGELTVFTNALRTAVELSEMPGFSVILPGGQLRSKELTLSGFPAEENLVHFNVDKAFIGIGGINENGISDFHIAEANLHRKLIKNARQSIALADSSKLGVRAMNNVCGLEDIDIVITDAGISKEGQKMLEKAGVQVIIAQC